MVASEAAPVRQAGDWPCCRLSARRPASNGRGSSPCCCPRYRGVAVESASRIYDNLPIWLGGLVISPAFMAERRSVPYLTSSTARVVRRAMVFIRTAAGLSPIITFASPCCPRPRSEGVDGVWRPKVIHCHDWQSATGPTYMRTIFAGDPTFYRHQDTFHHP